jgi:hypothetical protein
MSKKINGDAARHVCTEELVPQDSQTGEVGMPDDVFERLVSGLETPLPPPSPQGREPETETEPKTDKVFADNPSLDVYWKTSDGAAFYTESTAREYLRNGGLSDKTIKKIVRK